MIVAYTDRIVRLLTWHDAVFTTSAVVPTLGGVSSPFEELHFNLPSNNADGSSGGVGGGGVVSGGGGGDAGSNNTSAQGEHRELSIAQISLKMPWNLVYNYMYFR